MSWLNAWLMKRVALRKLERVKLALALILLAKRMLAKRDPEPFLGEAMLQRVLRFEKRLLRIASYRPPFHT
jgi:hypothetical protein